MLVAGKSGYSNNLRSISCAFLFNILISGTANAKTVHLSIKQTLEKEQHNQPQLEPYRQQAEASKEKISLAKNSIVPDLTAGYQVNVATFNNITGMSYPGFLLPISGPPSAG